MILSDLPVHIIYLYMYIRVFHVAYYNYDEYIMWEVINNSLNMTFIGYSRCTRTVGQLKHSSVREGIKGTLT